MTEFKMPSLGADMAAGKLVEWKVKPGDRIKRGDIIAVVETDKAAIEVEAFVSGIVDRLVAVPGQKLPVGTLLAQIVPEEGARKGAAAAAESLAPPIPAQRPRATPLARQRARESGIDLSTVQGTGPHGVIEAADIDRAAALAGAPAPAPAAPAEGAGGMRRAIAAAMSRSNREIPHYYLETSVNMRAALAWLDQVNQKRPIKDRILLAALLLKAVAVSLKTVPELNGYWIDDRLQAHESVHVGVAISLRQGGLVIPAIHDVDKKTLGELMASMSDLIERARAGRLRSSEIMDATITVTNLGDVGVETLFGVIYPPQVALVGFGQVGDRAWVEDGAVVARPILHATLAADHRATDGRRGAQFLAALGQTLQDPAKL